MIQRSDFPALWRVIRSRPNLVRPKPSQVLTLAIQHSHVRSKKLVGRASKKVAVDGSHINRPVRRIMHRVDVGKCPSLVRKPRDLSNVVDRSHRIGGKANGDNLRPATDFAGQVRHVKRAILLVNTRYANYHPLLFQRLPGCKIRVVIQAGQNNLVARLDLPTQRAAHRERQRSHIHTERDLIPVAPEKIRHRLPSLQEHGIGPPRRFVVAAAVCVVPRQIAADSVNHPLRNLRPARTVQENRWVPIRILEQCGELGAYGSDIELCKSFLSGSHGVL